VAYRTGDRIRETTTTTGTGALTLAGAAVTFRTFSAVLSTNDTCHYAIAHQSANEWEVGLGTLTASTTLARTHVLSSSNGGALQSFSVGTKDVWLNFPAAIALPDISMCQGRLSTESGVPESSGNRTAQATLYWVPVNGNRVALFEGSGWQLYAVPQVSLALTGLTNLSVYDVFLLISGGTPTLELSSAWTNATTRSEALATQDGVIVKSGALSRRHLGTIVATGTTTTEDSETRRLVWNRYNQVERKLKIVESTSSWTYNSTTWRQVRATSTNKVEVVNGDLTAVELDANLYGDSGRFQTANQSRWHYTGIGYDWTSGQGQEDLSTLGAYTDDQNTAVGFDSLASAVAWLRHKPAAGYHTYTWLEAAGNANTTTLFSGNGTPPNNGISGMVGWIKA
jgi:hypothetical protein